VWAERVCNLFPISAGRRHLRHEPINLCRKFWPSLSDEDVADSMPSLLHILSGIEESGPARFRPETSIP